MSSEGNKDISTEDVSMEQSSTAGAKRKRGRPRKYECPSYELPQRAQPIQSVSPIPRTQGSSHVRQDGVQASHISGDSVGPTFQVLIAQQTQGKDGILGKRFVGKMTNKFPGFCLITVKLKDNQMLKGWVPDQNSLNRIIPKDDLAPELPTLQPSKVQRQASAIPRQAAPPGPIHLDDVTLANPLQMRRSVDKIIAKHAIPLAARPYMGPGAVAAVPVSVSPSNVETVTVLKQDSECMISQSPVAAVTITSVRPISASAKQMANQNDSQKDSESSNGAKGSSVKAEKLSAALVDVAAKDCAVAIREAHLHNAQGTDEVGESSGTTDQPSSASCDHQISKESSDAVWTVHDEHKIKDDSK